MISCKNETGSQQGSETYCQFKTELFFIDITTIVAESPWDTFKKL